MEKTKDLNDLKIRLKKSAINFTLEETGIYDESIPAMFKHLIVHSEKDFDKLSKLDWKSIFNTYDIDFISIKKMAKNLELIHVTSTDNLDRINKIGFKLPNDTVGDLGLGIYFIDSTDLDSKMNLEDYLYDNYDEDDEIGIVTIEYSGDYSECVFGTNHTGYIVIKEPIGESSITDIDTITVEDFEAY